MNGWILVHKKIWESENFRGLRNKPNVILVWIWLLTYADDRGKVTFGRKQISKDTGIGESSVYRAIQHIATKMSDEVNIKANNTFSEILILNYAKYQRKPNNKVNNNRTTSEQQPNTNKEIKNKRNIYVHFDAFWSAYPKKVNKKKAQEIWSKLNPDKLLVDRIMLSLDRQKNSKSWLKDGGAFIPHPSTWLNQERWNDETELTTQRRYF